MTGSDGVAMLEATRWIVAAIGGSTAVGARLVGYVILGKQRMRNPRWPPHAKFHNGQSIIIGTFQGVLALAILFAAPVTPPAWSSAHSSARAAGWLCFGPITFPGTDWTDPRFEAQTPRSLGLYIQQLMGAALLATPVITVGLTVLLSYGGYHM